MARTPVFFACIVYATFIFAGEPNFEAANPSLEDLLRKLPAVTQVDVLLNPVEADRCIVHIKDWHLVPREMFAAEIRSMSTLSISDAKMDQHFEEHLREVESVQDDQIKLLRELILHHGLRRVFYEGLADRDVSIFRTKLRLLQEWETEIPELRDHFQSAKQRLEQLAAAGQLNTDEYRETVKLHDELRKVLLGYRIELIRVGAVGRLMLANELESVMPLEDLEAHRRANPLKSNGRIELRQADIESREDAQVKRLIQHNGVSVVILGGSHDLADNLSKLGPITSRYITVTTNSYPANEF